ncbi:MAG: hypothetical protein QXM96_04325, partial [Candidatus Woesearchaeota archaeon]
FWSNLPKPKFKTDLNPQFNYVVKANSENLPFENDSLNSVIYDPPFIIRCGKKKIKNIQKIWLLQKFK